MLWTLSITSDLYSQRKVAQDPDLLAHSSERDVLEATADEPSPKKVKLFKTHFKRKQTAPSENGDLFSKTLF